MSEAEMIDDFTKKKESHEEQLTVEFALEILNCELRKKHIQDDIKDIKTQAKSDGIPIKLVMNALKNLKRVMKENGENELEEEDFYLERFKENPTIIKSVKDLVD